MSAEQRRELQEALPNADTFEDQPGRQANGRRLGSFSL
jgi:hypothetical protein